MFAEYPKCLANGLHIDNNLNLVRPVVENWIELWSSSNPDSAIWLLLGP